MAEYNSSSVDLNCTTTKLAEELGLEHRQVVGKLKKYAGKTWSSGEGKGQKGMLFRKNPLKLHRFSFMYNDKGSREAVYVFNKTHYHECMNKEMKYMDKVSEAAADRMRNNPKMKRKGRVS